MAGRKQVPESALTGHRKPEEPYAVIVSDESQEPTAPTPPDGLQWSVAAKSEWARLWATPQAKVWDWDSAYSLVVQLVTDYDTWLHCQRVSRKRMIVLGSTGQERTHPFRAEMNTLFLRMQNARRELWLTPKAMRDGNIRVKRGPDEDEIAEAERLAIEQAARDEAGIVDGEFRVIGEDVMEFDDDAGSDEEGDAEDAFGEDEPEDE